MKQLAVGIDCRRLSSGGRGIDRFLSVLVGALPSAAPGLRLRLVGGRLDAFDDEGSLTHGGVSAAPGGLGMRMQYRRGVGRVLKLFLPNMDVFHFPGPDIWYSKRCATVVTVHDVAHCRFPGRFFSNRREEKRFRKHMDRIRSVADGIATDSVFSKKDIARFLEIEPGRIHVIPPRVHSMFRPLQLGRADREALVRKFHLLRDFVLFVGGNDFRKNLKGTLEALAILHERGRLDFQLVVVGLAQPPVKTGDDLETCPFYRTGLSRGHLVLAGRVDDADLLLLYNSARVFFFPSLFEGFGYPPLEAMACGTPVVASRRGGLSEVLGEAAYPVDPDNPEGMADALVTVMEDGDLRKKLVAQGLARASGFSPEVMARTYGTLYEAVGRSS